MNPFIGVLGAGNPAYDQSQCKLAQEIPHESPAEILGKTPQAVFRATESR
jgi:hypothetical protein